MGYSEDEALRRSSVTAYLERFLLESQLGLLRKSSRYLLSDR